MWGAGLDDARPPAAATLTDLNARHGRRVLLVFGGLERAGGQLRALEVCRELRRCHPLEVEICCLGLGPIELEEEARSVGAPIHLVPIRSPSFPAQFARLLRAGRFDVVNSAPKLLSGIVVWIAARERVPTRIVTFQNVLTAASKTSLAQTLLSSPPTRWLMRSLIARHATAVVAKSRSALDSMFPCPWQCRRECRVIYNGIALAPFRQAVRRASVRHEFSWPEDSRIVVNVARFVPQKNHRTLLEAVRLARESEPRIRLLLVGAGRLEADIEQRIDDLGLSGVTALTSGRTDVPRLLLASDVFCFPSLWEGLPGAALEALAAGLPLVASDIPPISELMAHFPGSIAVAAAEYAAAHAEHILSALEAPRDIEQAQARFAASPFVLEEARRAYAELYRLE